MAIDKVPAPLSLGGHEGHYHIDPVIEQLRNHGLNHNAHICMTAAWVLEELTGRTHPEWVVRMQERDRKEYLERRA